VSFALVPVARLRLEMPEAFVVDPSDAELDEDDDDDDDEDAEPAPDAEEEEELDDEDELDEELSESLSEPSASATGGFFNLMQDARLDTIRFLSVVFSCCSTTTTTTVATSCSTEDKLPPPAVVRGPALNLLRSFPGGRFHSGRIFPLMLQHASPPRFMVV
jgi:hypothetical protein